MKQLKSLFVICIACLSMVISCKKSPQANKKNATNNYMMGDPVYYTCPVYSTGSNDTNYIPHRKNNFWDYCTGSYEVADWTCKIISDTVINHTIVFKEWYDFNTSHAAPMSYTVTIQIDSLGNYYNGSALFIKPLANDGDTIYKNQGNYTRLVGKHDTYVYNTTQIVGCYHTESGNLNGTNKSDNYYKKGIGLLNFNGPLTSATIH